MSSGTKIDRSNLLIISFQLDGLCNAVRQSVACGLALGPGTIKTLLSLHTAFAAIHSGPSLEVLPKIDEKSAPSDILTFAEILRATTAAFLSPDEITEKRQAIGFQPLE
jgi:hypothetical protein